MAAPGAARPDMSEGEATLDDRHHRSGIRGRRNDADTDDDAQDRAPKQGLMIPASMGLRFQVPPDLVSFTITASWITYETVESGR